MRLAAFLALGCLALPAPADEPKDTFRKIEKGSGELLDAMGKEIKKAEDTVRQGLKGSGKKDDKKSEKPKDEKK